MLGRDSDANTGQRTHKKKTCTEMRMPVAVRTDCHPSLSFSKNNSPKTHEHHTGVPEEL